VKPFYGFGALTSIILHCNLTLITLLFASDGIVKWNKLCADLTQIATLFDMILSHILRWFS